MSFTPVTRTSHSIPKSLLEFSKDRDIDVKLLDFELISVETLIKRENSEQYLKVNNSNPINKADMIHPTTIIVQEYTIKIKPLIQNKQKIKLSLNTNKLKTKAQVTISKGSVFSKKVDSISTLKKEIWKRKLRAGLFVGLFESQLKPQLEKLFSILPFDKALPKDITLNVAQAINPIAPIDMKVEKLYEQKKEDKHNIVDGVTKGELILKYYKPKQGIDGRACNGKYIKVREAKKIHPRPKPDDTITFKEHNDFIEYFANKDGYVIYNAEKLCISNQLTLSHADYKSTGDISAEDANQDISVTIEHAKTDSEDAIGSGVKIDVKELNVDGAIGSNVSISTQELNVDAQTHKNSSIEVQNSANVKLHRGDLTAKDAEVDILENGKITAHRSIHIQKMLGGEALAPIVKVDLLLSNSTIIASELIEIKSIGGENNKLIINPDAIGSYHKDIQELKDKIVQHKKNIVKLEDVLQENILKFQSKFERIQTFQTRVAKATKAGKTPNKSDMLRIKEYKTTSKKLEEEKEVLRINKDELLKYEDEIEKMYTKEFQAKIVNHGVYDGHTHVTFIDAKSSDKISKLPEGVFNTITLTKNDKDELEILLN